MRHVHFPQREVQKEIVRKIQPQTCKSLWLFCCIIPVSTARGLSAHKSIKSDGTGDLYVELSRSPLNCFKSLNR